jgi:uncharacterized protein (DUF302 family)
MHMPCFRQRGSRSVIQLWRTMKRVTVCAVVICVLAFSAELTPSWAQTPPAAATSRLFIEDKSPKGLVPTVDAFRDAVSAGGWSILNVTNIAGLLSERGFTLHPVLIFDACSGKFSSELLKNDETRFVASMIPCRVAIYQTSAGQVVISRMNSVAMADLVGGEAGTIIKKSGAEMEQIVQATLQRLKP